jgi:ABC-type branched-subunit amino acid transport system ATPase component
MKGQDDMTLWRYFDETTGSYSPPITLAELDSLHAGGKIGDSTEVVNTRVLQRMKHRTNPIRYSAIVRLGVQFVPALEEFHSDRADKPVTVLSGPNNSGKTLLLKQLFSLIEHGGYLISCSRFSHVDVLNTRQLDENIFGGYYDSYIQNFYTAQQNSEENHLKLEQVITGLKKSQLDTLFSVCRELLGNEFSIKRTDPDRPFSSFYVDMDGQNLKYGSSGTRLLLTLLGTALDERVSILLIDEPELGLSPRIQAALAEFLCNEERRKALCPHLRQVVVATHSHLFLDRKVISNNWVVTKTGSVISLRQVKSIGDFHQLQFNMLGNEFESIFLPSAIVIVEGDSDVSFIGKATKLHIPDRKVAIVRAGGDGEVQNKLNVLKETFGGIETSPYRDRLFVVLDKRHSARVSRIQSQGVSRDNIVMWSQNGIEYLYPPELVAEVFRCDVAELGTCNFEDDPIELNGIARSKKELARVISDRMMQNDPVHAELDALLGRIRAACK